MKKHSFITNPDDSRKQPCSYTALSTRPTSIEKGDKVASQVRKEKRPSLFIPEIPPYRGKDLEVIGPTIRKGGVPQSETKLFRFRAPSKSHSSAKQLKLLPSSGLEAF
ncbi:hypothetical protein VNO78_07312 [Psophocarpus tetragonolobus]|uniref:Uncharacterized protein n=1 Tax=Psophocarpus tetragonolobus TaxID=3891 RepID=A0AAN9SU09_PSOTE